MTTTVNGGGPSTPPPAADHDDLDALEYAAERHVDLARDRLRAVQRQLVRREAGAADVAAAEHAYSDAIDQLHEHRAARQAAGP